MCFLGHTLFGSKTKGNFVELLQICEFSEFLFTLPVCNALLHWSFAIIKSFGQGNVFPFKFFRFKKDFTTISCGLLDRNIRPIKLYHKNSPIKIAKKFLIFNLINEKFSIKIKFLKNINDSKRKTYFCVFCFSMKWSGCIKKFCVKFNFIFGWKHINIKKSYMRRLTEVRSRWLYFYQSDNFIWKIHK